MKDVDIDTLDFEVGNATEGNRTCVCVCALFCNNDRGALWNDNKYFFQWAYAKLSFANLRFH